MPPDEGARAVPVAEPVAVRSDRHGLLPPLAVGAAALAATLFVGAVDPSQPGHYPTCPFLAVTGLYCPGCGSLRAIHALAHGDVVTALQRNPFAVVTAPFLVLGWALWVRRTVTGHPRRRLAPPWAVYLLLAVVLLFAVLRNVPGWTWLSPQ